MSAYKNRISIFIYFLTQYSREQHFIPQLNSSIPSLYVYIELVASVLMSANTIGYPACLAGIEDILHCMQFKIFWAGCGCCAKDNYEHKCKDRRTSGQCRCDDNLQWVKDPFSPFGTFGYMMQIEPGVWTGSCATCREFSTELCTPEEVNKWRAKNRRWRPRAEPKTLDELEIEMEKIELRR
jgi:hypothetical protein